MWAIISRAAHAGQAGLEAGLGVDQELTGGDHPLAFAKSLQDLHEVSGLHARLHLAGREPPLTQVEDHPLFLAGADQGLAGDEHHRVLVAGGPYTLVFWVVFVGLGLLIPLLIEVLEITGVNRTLAFLAPVLILIGGYVLRQVMIDIGQESTWTSYPTQFNAELFERLQE